MRTKLTIDGAYLEIIECSADERGYMDRLFDGDGHVEQVRHVMNPTTGTIRGLHFQQEPSGEGKLIHCTAGSIFLVLIDARDSSPTKRERVQVTLMSGESPAVRVPPGVASGYQTLEPNTSVLYLLDKPYVPEHADGLRWNDKWLNIKWPLVPTLISAQDRKWRDCSMRYMWLADKVRPEV